MKARHQLISILVAVGLIFAIMISTVQALDSEIGANQITIQINGQRIWQFTRYLASDEMEGREAGTEGEYRAAEYISQKFREWGLEPAGDDGTYYQNFTIDTVTPSQNVLGAIPGTDPEIGDEVVIVSAHYDHLGVQTGVIYPGADDDASGTAVMMEIAKVMASGNFAPKRTILFAAWGANEAGLLGSKYYADEDPKYPLNNTLAVLQMDMVGVGDRSGVNVYGGAVFTDLFSQIEANALEVLVVAQPFNPNNDSDDAPFYDAGVPAVRFQTRGPHLYYHTPADTIDTIDRYELELAGRVVAATAYELAMDEVFEVTLPTDFIYRHAYDED